MARRRAMVNELVDEPDRDTNCASGPGRRKRTTGAIVELYADGPIDRDCAECGAEPLQFCHWPNGTERRTPCLGR